MRRYYSRPPIDLTPWVRGAAGDTSDLRLPHRYRIVGLAKTQTGPYTLRLFRPEWGDDGPLVTQVVHRRSEVRAALEGLVDVAHLDVAERRDTVTVTDADGYIRSIEDA